MAAQVHGWSRWLWVALLAASLAGCPQAAPDAGQFGTVDGGGGGGGGDGSGVVGADCGSGCDVLTPGGDVVGDGGGDATGPGSGVSDGSSASDGSSLGDGSSDSFGKPCSSASDCGGGKTCSGGVCSGGVGAGVSGVTAGDDTTCAIAGGKGYCWGSDKQWQAGTAKSEGKWFVSPEQVQGLP